MGRRKELEATFLALLNRLQPDEPSIAEFSRTTAQAWGKKQSDAEKIAEKPERASSRMEGP
jgi:hypothetical protein